MSSAGNHLLVFGASGISGWACVKNALEYPTNKTFDRVTGLTNRPLSFEDAKLPRDSRLQLVSGIDLTKPVDEVVESMKAKVENIDKVTHVIYTAYIQTEDHDSLRVVNTNLLETAISAIDRVALGLQSVVLQTGGKAYGVEFTDKLKINTPLKESQSRIPKPYYDCKFYYTQYDKLKELSASKKWTFTETRPDVIVGFTPGTNFMSCAQGLALYLSLARKVLGEGAIIPFPGSQASWTNKHTDTSQDILVDDFVEKNEAIWGEIVKEHDLQGSIMEKYSWPFLRGVMETFDFDREFDVGRAREVGFNETIDTVKSFQIAFERMREARLIP